MSNQYAGNPVFAEVTWELTMKVFSRPACFKNFAGQWRSHVACECGLNRLRYSLGWSTMVYPRSICWKLSINQSINLT